MKAIPFEKVSVEAARETMTPEPKSTRPPEKDWSQYRTRQEKPAPNIKELMPWIQQLPLEVRPKQLIIQYARIANRLAILWSHPPTCEKYLAELILDKRGTRKGFPPEVTTELLALQRYFMLHVLKPEYSVWGDRIGG